MTVKGIDVASYQSSAYDTVGLSFVFVKATEGTAYVNPKHADQVAHARTADLVVGHYVFQRPGSTQAQADYFAAHAAVKTGDMIAVDWEDSGVSCANKDALIRTLQTKYPHNCVVLYCNRSFWLHRDTTSFCGDGLWIADPDSPIGKPNVKHSWTFHQYGISGADLDVANFASAAALKTWAAKGAVAPPKTPTTPKEATVPTADQMTAALYNDLLKIKRVDNGEQHAGGYFLAMTLQAVLDLKEEVQDLRAEVAALKTT